MNLKFVVNEYVLIWYLLFQQSISDGLNDCKQKIWNNLKKEYTLFQKEKHIILEDPKNYIPDDDTIYDMVKEFDDYNSILKETEKFKTSVIKVWDNYKKKIDQNIFKILKFDMPNYNVLLVNPRLNVIDISSDKENKIHTIVYGKKINSDSVQAVLEIIYMIIRKEFKNFDKENMEIVEAILELAIIHELGTRITGKSCYLFKDSKNSLIKRQIYPYFLMYLGIDRDDLVSYMRSDGIVFNASCYTNEVQLRKINIKEFIGFCVNNKKIILKLDKLGVK